jgi:hypothetical protein
MAAFVAPCRAEVLSERTIEFYLEGLNAYRTFARSDDRDLTLADVDLDIGRAWLADFVERGRKPPPSPPAPGRSACSVTWIVTEDYVRTDPLAKLKVPTIPAKGRTGLLVTAPIAQNW